MQEVLFVGRTLKFNYSSWFFHNNTFVIQDGWRCAPAESTILPNGFYVASSFLKDTIIVVKAGCAFKAFTRVNKTGQGHLAEGPVVLPNSFPFPAQSYECHCPKLPKIDCIPEEKFIPLQFSSLVRFVDLKKKFFNLRHI